MSFLGAISVQNLHDFYHVQNWKWKIIPDCTFLRQKLPTISFDGVQQWYNAFRCQFFAPKNLPINSIPPPMFQKAVSHEWCSAAVPAPSPPLKPRPKYGLKFMTFFYWNFSLFSGKSGSWEVFFFARGKMLFLTCPENCSFLFEGWWSIRFGMSSAGLLLSSAYYSHPYHEACNVSYSPPAPRSNLFLAIIVGLATLFLSVWTCHATS